MLTGCSQVHPGFIHSLLWGSSASSAWTPGQQWSPPPSSVPSDHPSCNPAHQLQSASGPLHLLFSLPRMLLPQLRAELSPSFPSGHHSSVTSSERPFLTALHKIIQHTHPLDLPPHSTCPVGSPLCTTGSPRGTVSIWVTAVLHTEDNARHREGPRTCLWNVPLGRQAWGPREQQPRS